MANFWKRVKTNVSVRGIVCQLTWMDLCLASAASFLTLATHLILSFSSLTLIYALPIWSSVMGFLSMMWLWNKPKPMHSWSPCYNLLMRIYLLVFLLCATALGCSWPFAESIHRQWLLFCLVQWLLWTVTVFFFFLLCCSRRNRYFPVANGHGSAAISIGAQGDTPEAENTPEVVIAEAMMSDPSLRFSGHFQLGHLPGDEEEDDEEDKERDVLREVEHDSRFIVGGHEYEPVSAPSTTGKKPKARSSSSAKKILAKIEDASVGTSSAATATATAKVDVAVHAPAVLNEVDPESLNNDPDGI